MITFNKDNVPPEADFKSYRKHAVTKATRINGPFTVDTSEGTLTCKDGYLCIDARGYPYPVATNEFDLIYNECEA